MSTHAFRHEPRSRLTDQQRAKLFLDHGGRCHRCTRKIRTGEKWYDEHVTSLENGGSNDIETNRALTCCNCFHPKNAEDRAKAAKTRDIATSHIIPRSQRQKKSGFYRPGNLKYNWLTRRYERE